MYKEKALITYYALTPLHMGAGSSISFIDLPIQREKHTSFPIMAASGIKGVFRSFAERKWNDNQKVNMIFGPEEGGEEYSSCISFTDARILLYPVRSVKNVFAWITCPFVLNRFKEDLKSAGFNYDINLQNINITDDQKIIVPENSKLIININNQEKKVGIEEFVFNVQINNNLNENLIKNINNLIPNIETNNNLIERFAIVSDNVFTDLINYAVEVRTRIKIDQLTGTAQGGALFTIEMVPSESIFYSLLFTTDSRQKKEVNTNEVNAMKEIINLYTNNELVLQFGGDETIGIGFTKLKINFYYN